MEIFINNNLVSFELESENNCFEVVSAIIEYAESLEPKQFISSLHINGEEFSLANDSGLKGITIDEVSKIEVITNDVYGLSVLSLSQIKRYLDQLSSLLSMNIWDSLFAEISDSINWMDNGISQIISIFKTKSPNLVNQKEFIQALFSKLDIHLKSLKADHFPLSSDLLGEIVELITGVELQIDIIIETVISISDFDNLSNNLSERLESLIESVDKILSVLPEVSVMFQSGKDADGMEVIKELSGVLDSLLKVFNYIKTSGVVEIDTVIEENGTLEIFIGGINNILRELLESIQKNDFVMIGDLLEYEFVPQLTTARGILDNVIAAVKSNTKMNTKNNN